MTPPADARATARELFERATEADPGGVLLTLMDFSAIDDQPEYGLVSGSMRQFAVEELQDAFNLAGVLADAGSTPEIEEPHKGFYERTSKRAQMIAYMLLWEAHLFQRILMSLLDLAHGDEYNPLSCIKPDGSPWPTRDVYQRCIARARRADPPLMLADLLSRTYSSQLRNAIAHTDVLQLGNGLSLQNHRDDDPESRRWIPADEWGSMHSAVVEFADEMFGCRHRTLSSFRDQRLETAFVVNGVRHRTIVYRDDAAGRWTAAPR